MHLKGRSLVSADDKVSTGHIFWRRGAKAAVTRGETWTCDLRGEGSRAFGAVGGGGTGQTGPVRFTPHTRPFVPATMFAPTKCPIAELTFIFPLWLREGGFAWGRSRRGGGGKDGHAGSGHAGSNLVAWRDRWRSRGVAGSGLLCRHDHDGAEDNAGAKAPGLSQSPGSSLADTHNKHTHTHIHRGPWGSKRVSLTRQGVVWHLRAYAGHGKRCHKGATAFAGGD